MYNCIYKNFKGLMIKKMINIRLDDDLLHILDYTAKITHLNRTTLIQRAILAYQDKMDEMISDKIMDEITAGEAKLVSYEKAKEKLGWK